MSERNAPPTIEEIAQSHQCWWRGMAERLSETLQILGDGSTEDVLRQLLRDETKRRKEADHSSVVWEYRARQAGWTEPELDASPL
jgi:hypothetical protein